MSIVTYENVDAPVFEIDFLRYLFANGEKGLLLSYQPDHLYADVDKTVPAVFGGGIASFDDLSGNGVTGPQSVSTARPIFRASPARGEYDSADDVLPHNATLPAITDGTAILIGQQGIWIDEGYSFAGGNWSFGPTTYPNGPVGIIGVVGDMLDLVVLDRPLTADERDRVVAYGVKRGSAGLIELGPELVVNGTFDTDVSGWSGPGGPTWEDGAARSVVDPASFGGISGTVSPPAVAGSYYLAGLNILENSGNAAAFRLRGTATNNPRIGGALGAGLVSQIVSPVTGTSDIVDVYNNNNATSNRLIDDVSLRRLIMPGEMP